MHSLSPPLHRSSALDRLQTPFEIRLIDLARRTRRPRSSPERHSLPPDPSCADPGSAAPIRFVRPPMRATRNRTPARLSASNHAELPCDYPNAMYSSSSTVPCARLFWNAHCSRSPCRRIRNLRNHRRHIGAEQLSRIPPNCNITPIGDLCRAAWYSPFVCASSCSKMLKFIGTDRCPRRDAPRHVAPEFAHPQLHFVLQRQLRRREREKLLSRRAHPHLPQVPRDDRVVEPNPALAPLEYAVSPVPAAKLALSTKSCDGPENSNS